MVSFPITVTPSASLRIIPVGTHLIDASMGGQILLGPGGTIKGESRANSIVKATSALPRWTTGNRPYSGGTYPLGDMNNWGQGLISGEAYTSNSNLCEVRNLTAWGGVPMAQFPYADSPSGGEWAYTQEEGSGIWMWGVSGSVIECDVYEHRGSGIRINSSSPLLHPELSTTMNVVESCHVSRCWNGILIDAEDTQVYNCTVSDCRNSGLFMLRGTLQSANGHYYGATTAMQWGIIWSSPTAANKSYNDTVADAPYGFFNAASDHGSCWGMFMQHCWSKCAVCTATTHFYDPRVLVGRSNVDHPDMMGINLQWPGSSVTGGNFQLCDDFESHLGRAHGFSPTGPNQCGCTGIVVENSDTMIDSCYFTGELIRKGTSSTPEPEYQRQVGILFKHVAADTEQRAQQVTNCHFRDFEYANCFGLVVEDSPTSPGTGQHAWRGGGNRAAIFGRGTIGATDKRLKLPLNWATPDNKIWVNGDPFTTAGPYP